MDVEQRAWRAVGLSWADYWMERGHPDVAHDFDAFSRAEAWALQRFPAAFTPPEGSDQSLLELAATFETCIPFLPSAGQRNIGKAVAQLRHMAMGYVLVPVTPAYGMVKALADTAGCNLAYAALAYRDALAARPEVPDGRG